MEIIGGTRSRDYSLDRGSVDIEEAGESRAACRCDDELARVLNGSEPALILVMAQERSAHRTGDVRAPLGPIGAAPEKRPARAFERFQVDAEITQHGICLAAIGARSAPRRAGPRGGRSSSGRSAARALRRVIPERRFLKA